MPICAPSNNRSAGFTLVELLVVLTVIGLVAAAAAPRLGARPASVTRQQAAAKLGAAIAMARREAAVSGTARTINPQELVAGSVFEPALPSRPATARLLIVQPDSSSTGGAVSLDGRRLLIVDWLTSEVRDAG